MGLRGCGAAELLTRVQGCRRFADRGDLSGPVGTRQVTDRVKAALKITGRVKTGVQAHRGAGARPHKVKRTGVRGTGAKRV